MSALAIWIIGLATIGCVLARPLQKPEWVWASIGACLLLLTGLETLHDGVGAFLSGLDVYLFLIGMMLISETAREAGVFDWLADWTLDHAKGSSYRLFGLVYLVGAGVTIFLSNDATAVVLTPAVYACVRRARVNPLPALFACALVANAASFVLPLSNPANLVVYREQLPSLLSWLSQFGLASVVSITLTFLLLSVVFRKEFVSIKDQPTIQRSPLSRDGRFVIVTIAVVSAVLLYCSSRQFDLGLPTFVCAIVLVFVRTFGLRAWPTKTVRAVSWGVIPMVGGLFVVVDAINRAGALQIAKQGLEMASRWPAEIGKVAAAFGVGALSNIVNNLPIGLTIGEAVHSADLSEAIRKATLIGVDLGPNLSVTGSLATLLWLIALRREGVHLSFVQFLKVGAVAMPITLFFTVFVL